MTIFLIMSILSNDNSIVTNFDHKFLTTICVLKKPECFIYKCIFLVFVYHPTNFFHPKTKITNHHSKKNNKKNNQNNIKNTHPKKIRYLFLSLLKKRVERNHTLFTITFIIFNYY
jgi:hypothetical protein